MLLEHPFDYLGIIRALWQILIRRFDDHRAVLFGEVPPQLLLRVHILLLLLADKVVRFSLALMGGARATTPMHIVVLLDRRARA